MKIFPLSDPILLPLAPAITRAIAECLHSIAREHYLNSLNPHCVKIVTEFPQDWSWQWQCLRSIRQIPIPQYQYVSTIAHQLAAKSALTPIEICQQLQIPLSTQTLAAQSLPLCLASSRLELECWYNAAGDIYFQLSPTAIATWLNYIHDLPIEGGGGRRERGDGGEIADCRGVSGIEYISVPDMSLAIYAHARCCSLLRLADREKLVTISASWQISEPHWLQNLLHQQNRLTGRLDRFFEHPAEQRLIQVLMAVLDGIYGHYWLLESTDFESIGKNSPEIPHRSQSDSVSQRLKSPLVLQSPPARTNLTRESRLTGSNARRSPNWAKLTIDLARSWLEFHRYCQVFGDLTSQHPHLAIARCGLTAISRRYLELLLVSYLGVDAPIFF